MADAEEIVRFCNELGITYIALTPNLKALERAIAAKCTTNCCIYWGKF